MSSLRELDVHEHGLSGPQMRPQNVVLLNAIGRMRARSKSDAPQEGPTSCVLDRRRARQRAANLARFYLWTAEGGA